MSTKECIDQTEITAEQIEFLRKKKLFAVIAAKIPSTRPQKPGACISAKYVSQVLSNPNAIVNDTTRRIIEETKSVLDFFSN